MVHLPVIFFLNNNFFGPVPDFSDGIQLFTLSLSLSLFLVNR